MKYKTKCIFCGNDCITTKGSANEKICYTCRVVE
jgi:hypothetical protein